LNCVEIQKQLPF